MTGLRPRPEVPDDVAAAVRQAVDSIVREARRDVAPKPVWRFSGRWFSAHPIRTRSRPG